jgi:phosphotransferase system HPr (HPr) family protein
MSPNSEIPVAPDSVAAVGTQDAAQADVTVTLPANLHARPAGKLAQAAARFDSTIRLEHGGRTINPTGVLAVMGLGATTGTTVRITAHGTDAEAAVRSLADILANAE